MREKIKQLQLADLFPALRTCVMERLEEGRFRLMAPVPEWLLGFDLTSEELTAGFQPGEQFPFLENFIADSEAFWRKGSGGVLRSGPWVETTTDGAECHLEASALLVNGAEVLLVQELIESYEERRKLLQRARENSLNYQRLIKEIQEKEVLLHCIVHDLAGPLMGLKGLLTLLGREELSESGQRRLRLGQQASEKLESLMQGILEVFSAELEAFEAFSSDSSTAPDIAEAVGTVVEMLRPAATLKDIALKIESRLGKGERRKVVGEAPRLERVLFNLLENAFRYTPGETTVTVSIKGDEEEILVEVCDQGPGIEPEIVPQLFRKIMQGKGRTGKSGLGLYFCRIVVERWGGTVGYSPRDGGGSIFWFRLPRAQLKTAS